MSLCKRTVTNTHVGSLAKREREETQLTTNSSLCIRTNTHVTLHYQVNGDNTIML